MQDLQDRLNAAKRIAMRAAPVTMAHFRTSLDITAKADESPVTIADQATEQAIRAALAETFPGETIFGEEFGQSGAAADMWVVDPIDGTRSFIAGLPLFGMLLGFVSRGAPRLGVINMPALGELFAGASGLGATMNGAPIHPSACTSLADARLFVNEADRLATAEPRIFARLISAGGLRRMAADCYPHALVAMGHADAVIDFGLKPYDYLPVSAVVDAAGGRMTNWQGQPLSMSSDGRTLTAATSTLLAELVELVNN